MSILTSLNIDRLTGQEEQAREGLTRVGELEKGRSDSIMTLSTGGGNRLEGHHAAKPPSLLPTPQRLNTAYIYLLLKVPMPHSQASPSSQLTKTGGSL